MIAPGRSIADRPARVPADPPMACVPVGVLFLGAVAVGWIVVAGIAWTAHAICRVTGIIRP
ncbi:MAG TPA: hypothetical protein PLB26_21490 [Rubrivivax sp.]|nr:hypothetical protein [Rubrivivax sp.]